MIYFNNASDSFPKPLMIQEIIKGLPYIKSTRSCNCDFESEYTSELRKFISFHLNVPDKDYHVILTNGSTESANTIIRSFSLYAESIYYHSNNHNCVCRTVEYLNSKENLFNNHTGESINHQCDDLNILDKSCLYCINHQSNVDGAVFNVKDVLLKASKCKYRPYICIDISQSIGNIDIDISEWHNIYPNLYIFGTFHKALQSIIGCGFIISNKNYRLKPLITGGTDIENWNHKQPEAMPHYLESGSRNYMAIVCALRSMMNYELTMEYNNHKKSAVTYFKKLWDDAPKTIKKLFNLHLWTDGKYVPPFVNLIPINDSIGDYVASHLESEYQIITRFGRHCSPLYKGIRGNSIRLSFNSYNTAEEIDCFFNALDNMTPDIYSKFKEIIPKG